jgi:hypothetical protein
MVPYFNASASIVLNLSKTVQPARTKQIIEQHITISRATVFLWEEFFSRIYCPLSCDLSTLTTRTKFPLLIQLLSVPGCPTHLGTENNTKEGKRQIKKTATLSLPFGRLRINSRLKAGGVNSTTGGVDRGKESPR